VTLCLGYDSEFLKDGAGSQIHRQLGIFLIAKEFGFGYTHRTIQSLDGNYGDGMDTVEKMEKVIDDLDEHLALQNWTCNHSSHSNLLFIPSLGEKKWRVFLKMALLFLYSKIKMKNLLILIGNPNNLINSNPDTYYRHIPKTLFSKKPQKRANNKIKVHFHIVGPKNYFGDQNRFLPIDYHIEIFRALNKLLLERNFQSEYFIHTDSPTRDSIWRPPINTSKQTLNAWRKSGILNKNDLMEVKSIDFSSFSSVESNLTLLRGLTPVESWKRMSEADILVTSKSMFSFVGAILTKPSLVIAPIFNQKSPRSWLTLGSHTSPELARLIEDRIEKSFN
jgi:hypothetical protein